MTETTGASAGARRSSGKKGVKVERIFTTPGVHPYDEVTWEHRDIVQQNWKTGVTIFEQRDVEFPEFWSVNASTIVTTKYFRGAVGTPEREKGLKQLIDRVVLTYVKAGTDNGYFATPEDAELFEHELTWALLHQVFSFNSPVWFNVGTTSPQQVSACFILAVDDSIDSILNWYREEGFIFKGGSGAGVNLSRIRSSKELLSSGGTASGPVSFMRGADASAGTIKSGGATRRAAKMVVLDIDHPDIEDFVQTKAREERKIRALRDAGFDMDLDGKDIISVQYQNANNSVRVTDEFMRAVEEGTDFGLRERGSGEVIETVDAKDLFEKIAKAAWECADPGIQYDDTINDWHTNPETGRITASNPCSEYMSLDNSSCNLASLNLMKFLRDDDTFDAASYQKVVELVITAMDISICFADFPTEPIAEVTRDYRQLGVGYANLGALLMATGHGYDSDGGRALAGALTSLMTGAAYKRSAELAAVVGPYAGYARNADAHKRVMRKHQAANDALRTLDAMDGDVHRLATKAWDDVIKLGEKNGFRNAQASLLAPTGTIGFMMDCDTTGIEPDFSLVKFKELVGGGQMTIVNRTVPLALQTLGYSEPQIEQIEAHLAEHGTILGAPGLAEEHLQVFDVAVGERAISHMGHLKMMGAVQPFISGAISKTVNLPQEATVEDIADAYTQAWHLGIKALAIYRDGSKTAQALRTDAQKAVEAPVDMDQIVAQAVSKALAEAGPRRKRMPRERQSLTHKFSIGGHEGYITAGMYADGSVGEIFLTDIGKEGSTLRGMMNSFATAISIALQYGVPLETLVRKFSYMRFEPEGITGNPEIPFAKSMPDYIMRWLASRFLDTDTQEDLGILTSEVRARKAAQDLAQSVAASDTAGPGAPDAPQAAGGNGADSSPAAASFTESPPVVPARLQGLDLGPACSQCGGMMQRTGSCYTCSSCGNNTGCG